MGFSPHPRPLVIKMSKDYYSTLSKRSRYTIGKVHDDLSEAIFHARRLVNPKRAMAIVQVDKVRIKVVTVSYCRISGINPMAIFSERRKTLFRPREKSQEADGYKFTKNGNEL
jgi:hypothetical protein